MSEDLDRVKGYLLDLGLSIVAENEAEELVVVDDEDSGIKQLVIDCEAPIVVLEQLIAEVPADPGQLFVRLLQMNNTLVHGAFVLDEDARRIFYRDTLQTANLDLNELEGSIRALSLALAEYGDELLSLLKR
ncbi:MAG: YbjN domain-containing protein [Acidobacteria bacterium]|nr:YbjN domain-containing protein [Acidobacteriota bacterium]